MKISKQFFNLFTKVFWFSLILGLFVTVFLAVTSNYALKSDFLSVYTGALIVRMGEGKDLYDETVQRRLQQNLLDQSNGKIGVNTNLLPYLNLPALTLFFIPFTFLEYTFSYKIYMCVLILFLLFISIISAKIFKGITRFSFWSLMPFLFYPSIGSVFMGQMSAILVFLFLAIIYYCKKKNYFWVGILASLLLLKIQYFIAIPFFFVLAKGKSSYLKGLFLGTVIILGLSFLISGIFLTDYRNLLVEAQRPEYGLLDSKMFTLYASLKQLTLFSYLNFNKLFIINFIIYLLFLVQFAIIKNKITFERGLVVAVLLTMVFCIHGVDYDQSLLLIPIYTLLELVRNKNATAIDKAVLILLAIVPALILTGNGVYTSFVLLLTVILLVKSQVSGYLKKI